MTFTGIMSFVWLALGAVGLITGSDPLFIVGLVSSVVSSASVTIIDTIKKENI